MCYDSTLIVTLQNQLSGYGAREPLLRDVVHELTVQQGFPLSLELWEKDAVMELVSSCLTARLSIGQISMMH